MKLNTLNPGDHFQFVRSNGPSIHKVIDPEKGLYVTVGQFIQGMPRPFCTRGDCSRHQHPIAGSDRPERAVHKRFIKIEGWPDGMDDHEYLDTLEEIQRGLNAIRGVA